MELAEQQLDIFLTIDRGITYQQNIGKRKIALILLMARSNSVQSLQPLRPGIQSALSEANAGEITRIGG